MEKAIDFCFRKKGAAGSVAPTQTAGVASMTVFPSVCATLYPHGYLGVEPLDFERCVQKIALFEPQSLEIRCMLLSCSRITYLLNTYLHHTPYTLHN